MSESVVNFEVPLYWVNHKCHTTKTIFYRQGDERPVTFLVSASINLDQRFANRVYRIITVMPTSRFPYLTRREALIFRDILKEELLKQMYPYPVVQFGHSMFEGMGDEIIEGIHAPVLGRPRNDY